MPTEGAFQLWVLDVGQGLSVLLRTHGHALLYDAGARYPPAADVARLAAPIAAEGGGIAADRVQPVYLRDKVALTLAEQRRR